jgi:hypothetical protein
MGFTETLTISHGNLLLDTLGGLVTRKVTIAADPINKQFPTGALMGKITKGTVSKISNGAGVDGANTGTGTLTLDATAPLQAKAKLGTYAIVITRAFAAEGTVAGAFEVYDPDGYLLGTATIGDTWSKHIKFVLVEDGATKFVVGDAFDVTLAAGNGQLGAFNPEAVNGCDIPYGILGNPVDVEASESIGSFVYLKGKFDQNAVSVIPGVTLENHKDTLRSLGIYLVDVQDEI